MLKEFHYDPPPEPLNIIYHDNDIIVISKPDGLLSVPGKPPEHHDCLERRIQQQFPNAKIVHRLDHATSGIMVMARTPEAQAHLGKQFENRSTQKTYIARIWGQPKEDKGTVSLPLRCDWPNRPLQMVCHEHGKNAETQWQVMEREKDAITRVMLKPETGRSHQLRVHMLAIGHPILGDVFYGTQQSQNAALRLQLHAQSLSFYHPRQNEIITFEDPCPF